jgi:hypothetical protein
MIDGFYLNLDEEMIKKIDQYFINKNIFCKTSWIKNKIEIYKNSNKIETDIYKEILSTDIKEFIDPDRVKNYCDLNTYLDFNTKQKNINDKTIFAQIIGYSNIAEPSEKQEKNEESLDVLDQFESKFLQGDDDSHKKAEKVVLKFQLSNGINTFYGFEYENVKAFNDLVNKESNHPKILIGPKVEIRRGIFYLKNDNVLLL